MQEHRMLSPALRKRLADLPEDTSLSLRMLAAEFGQYVPPEMAYRRWRKTGAMNPGMLGLVELNREQQVSLGRVRYVADALQRIGAKYTGSRISLERMYYLPPEARRPTRNVGPTFLKLPTPTEAIAHLERRFVDLLAGKVRAWTIDDQRAATALIRLAEGAIAANLVDELLSDHASQSPISPDIEPAGPPPGVINPRQLSAVERMIRWES